MSEIRMTLESASGRPFGFPECSDRRTWDAAEAMVTLGFVRKGNELPCPALCLRPAPGNNIFVYLDQEHATFRLVRGADPAHETILDAGRILARPHINGNVLTFYGEGRVGPEVATWAFHCERDLNAESGLSLRLSVSNE